VLNYNITPIDFGGTSDNVALAPGVDMPVYALLAVAVVLMIIGCAMMSQHELGHFPLVLMLLAVWALGLWQVELLYIAVILTIAFIVVEFIIPRSEKHRSEHHG
jgi:chromate transport protein ChrA